MVGGGCNRLTVEVVVAVVEVVVVVVEEEIAVVVDENDGDFDIHLHDGRSSLIAIALFTKLSKHFFVITSACFLSPRY